MPESSDSPIALSVLMPANNEEASIENALTQTTAVLDKLNTTYEIILINDHSVDRTAEIAKIYATNHPMVHIVQNSNRCGKGSALQYGFRYARGTNVLFFDSDLDLNPKRIPEFIRILENEHADIVAGSKCHVNSTVRYPRNRWVISYVFRFVLLVFFRLPVRDTQTGMKLFRRNVLEQILPYITVRHFIFDLELIILAHRLRFRIVEAPIDITVGTQSNSKVCIGSLIVAAKDTLRMWVRYYLLRHNPAAMLSASSPTQ